MRVPEQIRLGGRETITLAYAFYRYSENLEPFSVGDLRDDIERHGLPGVRFYATDSVTSRVMRKLLDMDAVYFDGTVPTKKSGPPRNIYSASTSTEPILGATLDYYLQHTKYAELQDGTLATHYLGMTVVADSVCENLVGLDSRAREIIADSVVAIC